VCGVLREGECFGLGRATSGWGFRAVCSGRGGGRGKPRVRGWAAASSRSCCTHRRSSCRAIYLRRPREAGFSRATRFQLRPRPNLAVVPREIRLADFKAVYEEISNSSTFSSWQGDCLPLSLHFRDSDASAGIRALPKGCPPRSNQRSGLPSLGSSKFKSMTARFVQSLWDNRELLVDPGKTGGFRVSATIGFWPCFRFTIASS